MSRDRTQQSRGWPGFAGYDTLEPVSPYLSAAE